MGRVRGGCGCLRAVRIMGLWEAGALYEKLSPFLRIQGSFGCHVPDRKLRGYTAHKQWPLHAWAGPGHYPLILTWNPHKPNARQPTFLEFLQAYNIEVQD